MNEVSNPMMKAEHMNGEQQGLGTLQQWQINETATFYRATVLLVFEERTG